MLWEIFWGALHVCRSKIEDVEISFYIRHIFESPRPRGCSWRGYATQEADQELKWKLRTISVWENWVLEFLGSHSWDTRGGSVQTPPRRGQYLKKPAWNRVNTKKYWWQYISDLYHLSLISIKVIRTLKKESLRDVTLQQGVMNIWIFARFWSCWENPSKSLRAVEKNKEKVEANCTGFSAEFLCSQSVEMFCFARKTKIQMLTTSSWIFTRIHQRLLKFLGLYVICLTP